MRTEFRICATCRNLEILEHGREFADIADTEFVRFRCRVLGISGREDYLMAAVEERLPAAAPSQCPFWEGAGRRTDDPCRSQETRQGSLDDGNAPCDLNGSTDGLEA